MRDVAELTPDLAAGVAMLAEMHVVMPAEHVALQAAMHVVIPAAEHAVAAAVLAALAVAAVAADLAAAVATAAALVVAVATVAADIGKLSRLFLQQGSSASAGEPFFWFAGRSKVFAERARRITGEGLRCPSRLHIPPPGRSSEAVFPGHSA
jgi:hypothetical protein